MFQQPIQLCERFGHARFDGAGRNAKHLGDFMKFQTLIMPQGNDFAIGRRELLQGPAHRFGAFASLCVCIRRGFVCRQHIGGTLVGERFQRTLPAPFVSAKLVMAKVQGDAPKKAGELRRGLPIRPSRIHLGKGGLGQILRQVRVARHPRAKVLDRLLPPHHERGERLRVIGQFDAPHQLLVAGGEQRFNALVQGH